MDGSRASDNVVEDWRPVMRQVIVRAICDALGYTNLPPNKKSHAEAVREAQAWFLEPDDDEKFETICDIADVDAAKVRRVAKNLIQAKRTGDFTRVPDFWRLVFAENRMPNLTSIERALDHLKKTG